MASTTNYNWDTPDNSGLVKNGAQDMRTLGNAIDTSVWNVGFGQAAKNKLINADFKINQRNFTSTTTTGTYGFDRWYCSIAGDGTATYSAQTFTVGAAPVAGYEGTNFARFVTTGQTTSTTRTNWTQAIEDVRSLAGQTVTVSFWAKAATGTPKMSIEMTQFFGAGGSSTVILDGGRITLSTSWARYSATIAVPSISGKTIGGNTNNIALNLWVSGGSDFNARIGSMGIQSNTFDIWGVQVEAGSIATPFQTASGGSIQNELAMCQRYYYRLNANSDAAYAIFGAGQGTSTTNIGTAFAVPVTMRVAPTSVEGSNLRVRNVGAANFNAISAATIDTNSNTRTQPFANFTSTSISTALYYDIQGNNNTAAYVAFSAEL